MSSFAEVGKTGDFQDGVMKMVPVAEQEVLVARVDGNYYAVANRCTHMGGHLNQGKLDGTIVTCPRHGSQFDLKDGHVVRWLKGSGFIAALGKALKSPRSIKTYEVKVEGDAVFVATD
jgi:3-phenylpropionate/trans-cinnamate dioxygenase ferredoxin component